MTSSPEHTTLFISRRLTEKSPLRGLLLRDKILIDDQALIQYEGLSFDPPQTVWVFFYSKTGVKYFLKQCGSQVDRYRYIAFGAATQRYCKDHGIHALSADADVAKALRLIRDHDCLGDITFICGDQSLKSVHKDLEPHQIEELVIYTAFYKQDVTLGHYDYAILTSPNNAKCFFALGGSANIYIAIGPTTQQEFYHRGIDAHIPSVPSEEAILTLVQRLME